MSTGGLQVRIEDEGTNNWLPFESVFTLLAPVAGAAGDIVIDGAEAVIIPVLVATVLMPYLAPSAIVQQIRAERAASVHTPDQGI
jgi:hypothetical protein